MPFALGILIIKDKSKVTDEETQEQIQQDVRVQYLLGRKGFTRKRVLELSMGVHFRKRLGHGIPVLNQELSVSYSKWLEEPKRLEEEDAGKNDKDDDQDGSDGGIGGASDRCHGRAAGHPASEGPLSVGRKDQPLEEQIAFLYLDLPDCHTSRTYRRKARQAHMRVVKEKTRQQI